MADEHEASPSGRITTASIDRRVERLELTSADMQRTIDRLELGQDHLRELVNARFTAIDGAISAQGLRTESINSKIDNLTTYIQNLINDAYKQSGDVNSTAAGRAIAQDIMDLRGGHENLDKRIGAVEKTIWKAVGGVGVILFIVQIGLLVVLKVL